MDTRKPRSARDFIELARRKSAESREELFGNIADLFFDEGARLSDRERSLMTGILRSLFADIEAALRRELSASLADRGDVPEELKSLLAQDGADIARPILMRSRALRTPELVEIVKFRGREHGLAVAMRPSLARDAGEPGPAGGEDDAIEALLRHSDPELVQHASDYLVAEAERTDRLQMPVLRPADLPDDLALRVHWWVSAALRAHIVNAFAVNPTMIDDQIESATRAVVGRHGSAGTAISEAARRLIERLAVFEPVTMDLLIRLLRSGRIPAFIAGLSQFAAIPQPTARRIALQADGESLAIVCRASGVDRDGFLALCELVSDRAGGSGQLPSDARDSILAFFDAISKGNARAALNFWRRDPEFVSAIEQVAPATKDPPTSQ